MIFLEKYETNPEEIALSDSDTQRTWAELHKNSLRLANYFITEKNLNPNDHVALIMGNRLEFIEIIFASLLSGIWITPINTHLVEAEVLFIVKNANAKLVIVDREHEHLVKEVACETQTLSMLTDALSSFHTDEDKINANSSSGGTMLYTSGTTGKPKGVRRNKPNTILENFEKMKQGAKAFSLTGQGPHLVTGPLYHAAPMLFALYDMLLGAPMVIMKKWDNETFLNNIQDYQIKTTHLVPTMFVRLLNLHEQNPITQNLTSLDLVLHGAAPIAPSTKTKMIDWWGKILVEYWGASEAGTTTLVNSEDWLKHPGTVGKALPHFEVFVGDKQGNKSGQEIGPLYCKHQFLKRVFDYHQDPEKTLKAHPQDYIFCIGDIGYVDSEGYIFLSDRESNMIISGGVNIYPSEIEQALMEHTDIADVVVFGIPNKEWGESVKALIELKGEKLQENKNTSLSSQNIAQILPTFLEDKIARFKIPRDFQVVSEIPRTPTGKIIINKIKEQYG